MGIATRGIVSGLPSGSGGGSGGPVSWTDVTDKPSAFPSTWPQVGGKPTSFPSSWAEIAGKPDLVTTDQLEPFAWDDITGKPVFAAVALSGSIDDIEDIPFPTTPGTEGQVLTTNAEGQIAWGDAPSGGLTAVADDPAPVLGGDLDGTGRTITADVLTVNDIRMLSGDDLTLTASGGRVEIGGTYPVRIHDTFMPPPDVGGTVEPGQVLTVASKNGFIAVAEWADPPDPTTINGLTYPAADGTDGQVLTTDGSGNLSFQDAPAGGGGALDLDIDINDQPMRFYRDGIEQVSIQVDSNTSTDIEQVIREGKKFRLRTEADAELLLGGTAPSLIVGNNYVSFFGRPFATDEGAAGAGQVIGIKSDLSLGYIDIGAGVPWERVDLTEVAPGDIILTKGWYELPLYAFPIAAELEFELFARRNYNNIVWFKRKLIYRWENDPASGMAPPILVASNNDDVKWPWYGSDPVLEDMVVNTTNNEIEVSLSAPDATAFEEVALRWRVNAVINPWGSPW